MKQTIRLTESELRGMIQEAVNGAMAQRRPMRKAQPKRLTESQLRAMIRESVKRVLNESGGVMEEWYQEEDYDGNFGKPGMVKSYEPSTLYVHNFEQMAEEEGYKNWEEAFMFWWSEVKNDSPWYWVPEEHCKGGTFLFNSEADDVEELPGGQIVITGRHP